MELEIYHVGNTGPPIDLLLIRDGEIVDPSGATSIFANVRIGTGAIKFTKNALGVVVDDDGNKRVRLGPFSGSDLDTKGTYQAQVTLVWADNSETSPRPHYFKVVAAW